MDKVGLISIRGRAAALFAAGALAACAGASEDPREGGLAGGLNGIATGTYEKRLDERRAAISDLDAAGKQLEGRIRTSEARLRELDRQISAQKVSLQRLRGDFSAIDRAIDNLRKVNPALNASADQRDAENAGKARLLQSVLAERAALGAIVDDLESQNRKQLSDYERASRNGGSQSASSASGQQSGAVLVPPPESSNALISDLERRSKQTESRGAEVSNRVQRLKAAISRAGA